MEQTLMQKVENAKAFLEMVADHLQMFADQYDFETEADEKARCEAAGENYEPWYCNECSSNAGEYEEARYYARRAREVAESLTPAE